jgi:tRNA A-37 threonylcarbamoyl transferase component Bud32
MEKTKIPGRYRLIEEVGQGGMAVVFRAHDETLKREVAIKLLHQHLAAEPESKARLEREAQAVAKLHHVNILEIFDYSGIASEAAYIVTEFIDGKTLKQLFENRPIRHPEVAAMIAAEIGGALAHAHSVGIIHRDVKPENVMIRKDGLLKLMDFGIAQVVDLQRMTVTGQLLGSPAYMAPELIEGKPLDFRTDVFSVGIILYQLATGTLPFVGKNPHEVLRRIGEGRFPDPRSVNRLIGDGLARVMRRALARNPDDRHPDVSQFVDELHENLAEAGLTDARAELRAFFADPDAYEACLPARLSRALIDSAHAHLAAGKTGRAMEIWNRVLALDPQNPQVLAALRGFENRHRWKKAALLAGGAAALALLGWGVSHAPGGPSAPHESHNVATVPRPAAPAPLATAPVATPATPATTTTAPALPDEPSHAEPARRVPPHAVRPARGVSRAELGSAAAVGAATPSEAPAPAAASTAAATPAPGVARPGPERVFTLGPTPQNVDVYLDGERKFAYDTDHKTLTVPWTSNHTIELRSPVGCCFSERIEVGPDRPLPPENIIARKLKWKPARLTITTEPPSAKARIIIKDPTGRGAGALGRAGEDIAIPFHANDERTKEVEVDVDTGDSFTSERITVRAGEPSSHVIRLKTTN